MAKPIDCRILFLPNSEVGATPADRHMKHEIKKSAKYKRIAERLISSLPEFDGIEDVRVAYLISDEEKKKDHKIIYADCAKVVDRYSWCCPYDFMITVYEQNCSWFTNHQREILIRHELHHIGIDNEGNEPSYYVVPHDVEEFWQIIRDEGLDWDIKKELRTGQEEKDAESNESKQLGES